MRGGEGSGLGMGNSFLGRTATAAVMGGTATAIGGGKFANGALTAGFMHVVNDEVARKMKDLAAIYARHSVGSDCVTTMRDALRELYSDPTIGNGLAKGNFRYDTLMDDLKAKGYLTPLADSSFSFNGTRATAAQDIAAQLANSSGPQPYMTRPIGDYIAKNGSGIYLMGIANGMHVMALVYDGSTYTSI
jgi:hypothetical protein